MKAYIAHEENEGYAVIVFAETAGKARFHSKQKDKLGSGLKNIRLLEL